MSHDLAGLNEKIEARGFFERILHERDRTEGEYRRRIDERFDALAKALGIQTAELARRLADLNHAHQQRVERDADFVPRETYEATMDASTEWRRQVDSALAALPDAKNIHDRISRLETTDAENRGAVARAKSDATASAAKISGGVGVLAVVVSVTTAVLTR